MGRHFYLQYEGKKLVWLLWKYCFQARHVWGMETCSEASETIHHWNLANYIFTRTGRHPLYLKTLQHLCYSLTCKTPLHTSTTFRQHGRHYTSTTLQQHGRHSFIPLLLNDVKHTLSYFYNFPTTRKTPLHTSTTPQQQERHTSYLCYSISGWQPQP